MKLKLSLISTLLSSCCLAAIALSVQMSVQLPVQADSSLSTVTRRGHLRIGVDASVGGPYLYWNPKTQYYDGFEWEIIKELASRLKLEAKPINTPWAAQPASLEARQLDIILSVREQGSLKSKFDETVPYYLNSQRILTNKDSKIATLRDLIGKRVGVVANSGGAAVLETYNNNRGNAIRLFSSRDIERMVAQLRDRQLDAMLLDEPVAVWQVRNNPKFAIVGSPLLPISLVAVVNKNDDSLKKAVNQALTQMKQEGKLESILRRWKLWENQKSLQSVEVLPVKNLLTTMPF
jgi:ABC-type amino acid transport substrate-binding protein